MVKPLYVDKRHSLDIQTPKLRFGVMTEPPKIYLINHRRLPQFRYGWMSRDYWTTVVSFGMFGIRKLIPPNSDLIFEVHLLKANVFFAAGDKTWFLEVDGF